ncbi:hypothetical protein MRX96_043001 [Rhipicephalus microplus]
MALPLISPPKQFEPGSNPAEACIARANNLKPTYNKLKLGLPTVTYLGYQLTHEVTLDPSKVKAINAIPAPT